MKLIYLIAREACRNLIRAACNVRSIPFNRAEHAAYLLSGLGRLASGYVSLDASRPWLCYWITHSLELLGPEYGLAGDAADDVANFLGLCQDKEGGFAGGPVPGQLPHLAPTYAAINALVTIGTPKSLGVVDRKGLKSFLRRMKTPSGAFTMHDDGEVDVRGAYIAMAVGTLCDVLDDDLKRGTAEWIASCQTYEGGIGATPGEEAHGGYTFCALAALVILGRMELLDLPRLTNWLVHRQMAPHGGFQGRTNKLVDGCYSFWQGGAFPLLEAVLTKRGELPSGGIASLFSTDVRPIPPWMTHHCRLVHARRRSHLLTRVRVHLMWARTLCRRSSITSSSAARSSLAGYVTSRGEGAITTIRVTASRASPSRTLRRQTTTSSRRRPRTGARPSASCTQSTMSRRKRRMRRRPSGRRRRWHEPRPHP